MEYFTFSRDSWIRPLTYTTKDGGGLITSDTHLKMTFFAVASEVGDWWKIFWWLIASTQMWLCSKSFFGRDKYQNPNSNNDRELCARGTSLWFTYCLVDKSDTGNVYFKIIGQVSAYILRCFCNFFNGKFKNFKKWGIEIEHLKWINLKEEVYIQYTQPRFHFQEWNSRMGPYKQP